MLFSSNDSYNSRSFDHWISILSPAVLMTMCGLYVIGVSVTWTIRCWAVKVLAMYSCTRSFAKSHIQPSLCSLHDLLVRRIFG